MPRINAQSLIELALATLRTEIQPSVPKEKRYALAMTLNALEIARREILADPEAGQWALLDKLIDDGEGTMADLARDIRTGTINDQNHDDLPAVLTRHLVAELEVRNPAALAARAKRKADASPAD